MSDQAKYIRENTVITCGGCHKLNRTTTAIYERDLPIVLKCPRAGCGYEFTVREVIRFPKVQPDRISDEAFWITASDPIEGVEVVDSFDPLDPEQEPAYQTTQKNFYSRAEEINGKLLDLLRTTKAMSSDIQLFESQMLDVFTEFRRVGGQFSEQWYPQFMQEFIINPYIGLPIPCKNEISESYSRLVLCPKFFRADLGIPVEAYGGYRAEIMNQFTRLNYPVTDQVLDYLGLPGKLKLQVHGNKLSGADLRSVWQDIPGLKEDVDHDAEWPSVWIKNQAQARQWLALHGVMPWDARPIKNTKTYEGFTFRQICFNDERYSETWDHYSQVGRMILFSDSIPEGIKFCLLAGCVLKGIKLIITRDRESMNLWDTIMDELYLPTVNMNSQRIQKSEHGNFVYRVNSEPLEQPAYRPEITNIILDLHSGIEPERIEELYRFNGNLLVLSSDPLMDFTSALPEQAVRTYGLAGHAHYLANHITENWKASRLNAYPEIVAALARFSKTYKPETDQEAEEKPSWLERPIEGHPEL